MTERTKDRPPKRRRLSTRARLIVVAVVFAVLALPAYSYVTMLLQPSSLPWTIRSIEWIRDNHGGWFVDAVENFWYTVTAPIPGGPGLVYVPLVGIADVPQTAAASKWNLPAPIDPVLLPGLPEEGVWRATTTAKGAPPVLVTVFRPDPAYPRQLAYVAWIDTSHTLLALYPGRREPPQAVPRGPMEVPEGARGRLLATFNSGFKYKDSLGGFVVNGLDYEPLVRGQGTLVEYASGRVDVLSWRDGSTVGTDVVVARQNSPLIVDGGQPNRYLNEINLWGTMTRVWRSAVGIDPHGDLIYMASPGQTASTMAAAMIHAGAVRAIQLDIHSVWPTFISYGHSSGTLETASLVPNSQQTSQRYLTPDDRDFFAVYTRERGRSLTVPYK